MVEMTYAEWVNEGKILVGLYVDISTCKIALRMTCGRYKLGTEVKKREQIAPKLTPLLETSIN